MMLRSLFTLLGLVQVCSAFNIPIEQGMVSSSGFQAASSFSLPPFFEPRRPGTWSLEQRLAHHELVRKIVADVDNSPPQKLSPAVQELKQLIESNGRMYMYFSQMFDEIPSRAPFWRDIVGHKTIRDYHHFLCVLNHIVSSAPDWPVSEEGIIAAGLPIIVIFEWPMSTQSGYAAFLDPTVNKALKKVLNEWGKFLAVRLPFSSDTDNFGSAYNSQSPNSSHVLNENANGWFGPVGKKYLEQASNRPLNTTLRFCELYKCDATSKHYGFSSWDDFFTRQFRANVRPVASPDDDNVITSACEATPSNLQRNVKLRDNFFIKGQPYSVLDMLNNDPLSDRFVGGTVYQGYLSSLAYHRWHAPVSGVVRRATVVDGTYFSLPDFETILATNDTKLPDFRIDFVTGYLSSLATRGIVIIEADNKEIGLVAFIAIGMDEVSTCQVTVKEGQHVQKGDDMGMFHFGGSSHCLLFQNGTRLDGFPSLSRSSNMPVRGKLATLNIVS